jgi:hypothetical protein
VDIYLHSPSTPSWRGSDLKHRDNFTIFDYFFRCNRPFLHEVSVLGARVEGIIFVKFEGLGLKLSWTSVISFEMLLKGGGGMDPHEPR